MPPTLLLLKYSCKYLGYLKRDNRYGACPAVFLCHHSHQDALLLSKHFGSCDTIHLSLVTLNPWWWWRTLEPFLTSNPRLPLVIVWVSDRHKPNLQELRYKGTNRMWLKDMAERQLLASLQSENRETRRDQEQHIPFKGNSQGTASPPRLFLPMSY